MYDVNGFAAAAAAGVMRPTLASGLKVRRRIGGGARVCIDLTEKGFVSHLSARLMTRARTRASAAGAPIN